MRTLKYHIVPDNQYVIIKRTDFGIRPSLKTFRGPLKLSTIKYRKKIQDSPRKQAYIFDILEIHSGHSGSCRTFSIFVLYFRHLPSLTFEKPIDFFSFNTA